MSDEDEANEQGNEARLAEKLKREEFFRRGAFTQLNEIVGYDVSGGVVVGIHLAPSRTIAPDERTEIFQAGLGELAERLKEDESLADVDRIEAVGWYAKYPAGRDLLEKHGFKEEEISQMEAGLLADSVNPENVGRMVIDRVDFLERFGDEVRED